MVLAKMCAINMYTGVSYTTNRIESKNIKILSKMINMFYRFLSATTIMLCLWHDISIWKTNQNHCSSWQNWQTNSCLWPEFLQFNICDINRPYIWAPISVCYIQAGSTFNADMIISKHISEEKHTYHSSLLRADNSVDFE